MSLGVFPKKFNNLFRSLEFFNPADFSEQVYVENLVSDNIQSTNVLSNNLQSVDAENGDSVSVATQNYVSAQVNALIGGSDDLLNTLGEISASINSDASFGIHVWDKLNAHDASFANVGSTLSTHENHLTVLDASGVAVNTRLNAHDSHFTQLDSSGNTFNTRLNAHDTSLNNLAAKTNAISYDSGTNTTVLNSKLVVALSETNQGATTIGNDTGDTLVINAQTTFANSNITGLTKANVGLSNVDNVSDINKSISTATQNALNLKSNDNLVVHLSGSEVIGGTKTFSSAPVLPNNSISNTMINNSCINSGYCDGTSSIQTQLNSKGGLVSSNTWSSTNNFTGVVQLGGVSLDTRISNIEGVNSSQATSISALNSKCSAIVFDSSNNITILNSKLSVGVDESLNGNLTIGDNASTDLCNLNASIVANGQTVSATRIGYLSTLSGNVQTALDSKCADSLACHLSLSENLTGAKTFSGGVVLSSNITANGTTISPTELSYIDGATSNIQTQINGKQATLTFDSTPTSGSSNPATSGGIYTSINAVQTQLNNDETTYNAHFTQLDSSCNSFTTSIATLNGKTNAITYNSGTNTTILNSKLSVGLDESLNGNLTIGDASTDLCTVNASLVSNSQSISPAQLGYISGLSSNAQTQINAKAPLAGPTFTGIPAAPTASTGDSSTQIATTAFVKNQSYLTSSSAASTYAPLANATLTGTPLAPTASAGDNSTQIATTAFVKSQSYLPTTTAASTYAPLASPSLTGVPVSTTASTGDNSTQIATTAFVKNQSYLTTSSASSTYAPLASATLTGTPLAPTASTGDNTTQIATTAFVKNQSYLTTSSASSTYAPLASATLTGTPLAPTASTGDSSTQIATTAFVKNQSYLTTSSASSTYAGLSSSNSLTGTNTVNLINETVNSVSSITTSLSLDYTTCKGINYIQTPTSNFSLAITNVPTGSTNAVYTITLMMAVKYYANSCTVNGTSRTMQFGGGAANVSINASANYVMQQVNVMFLNSSTPIVSSNVLSLF
jgi:hypothetical protein